MDLIQPPEAEVLQRTVIFQKLSADDAKKFLAQAKLLRYQKGVVIFAEGESAKSLYVVMKGLVKLYKTTLSGVHLTMTVAGPSDTLNAAGLHVGEYFTSAQCLTDTTLLKVTDDAYFAFLTEHPQLSIEVSNLLAKRVRREADRAVSLLGVDVQARIAVSLVSLAAKFGTDLPLSQKEIAECAGTTTETMSRILRKFRQQGIVAYGRQRSTVQILDMSRLNQLANVLDGWI